MNRTPRLKFLATSRTKSRSLPLLVLVTILIGITAGFGGMLLALLLHYIQHIAYGYSPTLIISNETFLQGVQASSPERRVIILTLCGLIAGFGWWSIFCYGKPLVSIEKVVKSSTPQMPFFTTFIHILLQIITIALGSPLGREVAPRELSTLLAGWICAKAGLSLKETQIMLGCAAGAGLAAVYNVPFGGAMFSLEVLLFTIRWPALLPALATSGIAAVVAWVGLGNEQQYHIPNYAISYSLVIWAIVCSPIFGFTGYWFKRIASSARLDAPKNWHLPLLCLCNFLVLGLLAIYFPALLGNGRSPARLEFDESVSLIVTAALLVLHTIMVLSSLRAGAKGGLLTPSLANGALLAVLLGALWNLMWAKSPLGAFAIIGAAAFLAAAQKMPLTAIVLIFEFTRVNFNFLTPILFAVAGAVGVCSLCMQWESSALKKKPQTRQSTSL